MSVVLWVVATILFHEAGHIAVGRPFGFRFAGFDTNGGFGVRHERFPARGLGRIEVGMISAAGPVASLLFAAFVWQTGLGNHWHGINLVVAENITLAVLCALPYGDSDGKKITTALRGAV